MAPMKHLVADLLLNLAARLAAKGEDRGSKIEDRKANPPSQRGPSSSHEMAEAIHTARPLWGEDEAKAVRAFLNSPAGQLFSRRIRSVAAHVAIEGANDRANTIHSAGVSAGWNECVRYIHSLSRVSGVQDTPRVGGSDSNDRPSQEDDAALLERLSP